MWKQYTQQFCKVWKLLVNQGTVSSKDNCKSLCTGGSPANCNAWSFRAADGHCSTYSGCAALGRDVNYDGEWLQTINGNE